jgi:hypothetical protein
LASPLELRRLNERCILAGFDKARKRLDRDHAAPTDHDGVEAPFGDELIDGPKAFVDDYSSPALGAHQALLERNGTVFDFWHCLESISHCRFAR